MILAVVTLALVLPYCLADHKIDWDAITREHPVIGSPKRPATDATSAKQCKKDCKHCQEGGINEDDVSKHIVDRLNRKDKVDWNKMK